MTHENTKGVRNAVKVNRKSLVAAAKELNEILGLDPEIDITQGADALKKAIFAASTLLEKGDKISKATESVIQAVITAAAPKNDDDDDADEPEPEKPKGKKGGKKGSPKQAASVESPEPEAPAKPATSKKDEPKTVFGSRVSSSAGKIDVLVAKGKPMTISQIAEALGVSNARVAAHLKHLMFKRNIAGLKKIDAKEAGGEATYVYTAKKA
jgi:hypothetical protein